MADIYLIKNKRSLVPADDNGFELVRQMKQGKVIKATYSFPRSYENHKRFFAFIKTTFLIQNHFDNMRHFRKWLVGKAGYYEIIEYPNGKTVFDTDSIAFDKMEEPDFRKMFNRCVDAFLSEFEPQISRNELYQVIDFI